MATAEILTAPFFDNPQYSDIIIKFGEHQIRAHKVILAQQSGYFATAFFSRFQVASNPVIDLGDEDDPELLTDTIRHLYRHGRVHYQLQGLDNLLSIDRLIDIYQLADKYDIPSLRQSAVYRLPVLAYRVIRIPTITRRMSNFLDCIARVCGPDSVQFADNTLKTIVLKICQTYAISLLEDKAFLQRYKRGELFDVGSATAFGVELSGRLLTSNGTAAGETDRFPNVKLSTMDSCTTDRYMISFFDDERLSDIAVTYPGKKISAHKIILATRSSYLQKLLTVSPTITEIDLGSEHDSAATAAFLKDMYSADSITPSPEHSLMLFPEMYLLAKKHGRADAAYIYDWHFGVALRREQFTEEYFASVTALCGPDSSRYVDTPLPVTALTQFCSNIEHMNDTERQTFKEKLEEGSLFNTTMLKRFAAEMFDSSLMLRNQLS
ncbi:hypothetical protein E4T52_11681 [Aureobasidium sp. EXF-3400]|nr:hypothetical protein E4T52_11681 [Aureobasidium sp. EXF-3400]